MADYVANHRIIWRRIHQTGYPKTQGDNTSVRFVLNVLDGHPKYHDASMAIRLTGILTTLRVLGGQLLEEEAATYSYSTLLFRSIITPIGHKRHVMAAEAEEAFWGA